MGNGQGEDEDGGAGNCMLVIEKWRHDGGANSAAF